MKTTDDEGAEAQPAPTEATAGAASSDAGPAATASPASPAAPARSGMTAAEASELVAERFSRIMNATTSPLGVAGDPPITAAVTAVFLVAYLAARQSDAAPLVQQVLLVLAGLPLAAAILVPLVLLGARRRVVAWLAGLPFPVENVNALLNGLGDGLEITFRGAVPETPQLNAKLDEIHADCFVTDSKDQTVTIRIGVIDSKRNPAASNHGRYKRVIELVERVLVPLHKGHPIDVVRVR